VIRTADAPVQALVAALAAGIDAGGDADRETYRRRQAAIGEDHGLLKANETTVAIPENALLHEFGEGATGIISRRFEDPYSEIIWPERLRRFRQQVEGNFVGVGIQIRHDERRDIQVVNPLEGGPAFRGGVENDDRIVAVDGKSTVGWTLNKAVDSITGRAGEDVTLTIRRESAELRSERAQAALGLELVEDLFGAATVVERDGVDAVLDLVFGDIVLLGVGELLVDEVELAVAEARLARLLRCRAARRARALQRGPSCGACCAAVRSRPARQSGRPRRVRF
jgi:hypothetical protein